MIVTVTGANGFIGSHLVKDQLARGREVRAVDLHFDRLCESVRHDPRLRLVQADIRDREEMRRTLSGTQRVFHLASAHLSSLISEDGYWEINREGSRSLVEISYRVGVEKFIHCSSVGVYGEITGAPADEDSDCRPDLVYERSKLAGERDVREFALKHDYPVVVVRPAWVYGPGCPRTEKLFRAIQKRSFFFVGEGASLRHCLYISDLIQAFNLCADRFIAAGRTFIIGDRSAVSVRQLVEQIAVTAGVAPPRLSLPLWMMHPAGVLLGRVFPRLGKEPPFSERSLKFFTNNTSFDISRAQSELGFEPEVSLQEGLHLTYQCIIHSKNQKRVA